MSLNSPRTPLFNKRGGRIFNLKETLEKRKFLRKDPTEAEAALWAQLRNKRSNGLKFFRQYGIGYYITDFYCPELKLAIEVDGDLHFSKDGLEYDRERSQYFLAIGITTIRFANNDVLIRMGDVLTNIEETCLEIKASPSLSKEGERGSLC